MITVILTIHVLIVLALIGIVLLQRSEGGALGIGGGGGGGFMTGRGAANALTRTTSILAALFFATSIMLAVFADRGETDLDIIQDLTVDVGEDGDARAVFGGAADALGLEGAGSNGAQDGGATLDPSEALKAFGAEAAPQAPQTGGVIDAPQVPATPDPVEESAAVTQESVPGGASLEEETDAQSDAEQGVQDQSPAQ